MDTDISSTTVTTESNNINIFFTLSFQCSFYTGLEPIETLKVTVPDQYTGDVMGDLNKRRGRVLGMTPVEGGKQIIEAEIPESNIFGYNTDLRSMTGGTGEFSYEFNRYEPAPADVQAKEIEARKDKIENIEE